jgi:hypothetical protein
MPEEAVAPVVVERAAVALAAEQRRGRAVEWRRATMPP